MESKIRLIRLVQLLHVRVPDKNDNAQTLNLHIYQHPNKFQPIPRRHLHIVFPDLNPCTRPINISFFTLPSHACIDFFRMHTFVLRSSDRYFLKVKLGVNPEVKCIQIAWGTLPIPVDFLYPILHRALLNPDPFILLDGIMTRLYVYGQYLQTIENLIHVAREYSFDYFCNGSVGIYSYCLSYVFDGTTFSLLSELPLYLDFHSDDISFMSYTFSEIPDVCSIVAEFRNRVQYTRLHKTIQFLKNQMKRDTILQGIVTFDIINVHSNTPLIRLLANNLEILTVPFDSPNIIDQARSMFCQEVWRRAIRTNFCVWSAPAVFEPTQYVGFHLSYTPDFLIYLHESDSLLYLALHDKVKNSTFHRVRLRDFGPKCSILSSALANHVQCELVSQLTRECSASGRPYQQAEGVHSFICPSLGHFNIKFEPVGWTIIFDTLSTYEGDFRKVKIYSPNYALSFTRQFISLGLMVLNNSALLRNARESPFFSDFQVVDGPCQQPFAITFQLDDAARHCIRMSINNEPDYQNDGGRSMWGRLQYIEKLDLNIVFTRPTVMSILLHDLSLSSRFYEKIFSFLKSCAHTLLEFCDVFANSSKWTLYGELKAMQFYLVFNRRFSINVHLTNGNTFTIGLPNQDEKYAILIVSLSHLSYINTQRVMSNTLTFSKLTMEHLVELKEHVERFFDQLEIFAHAGYSSLAVNKEHTVCVVFMKMPYLHIIIQFDGLNNEIAARGSGPIPDLAKQLIDKEGKRHANTEGLIDVFSRLKTMSEEAALEYLTEVYDSYSDI